jgi:hypothetical protein
VREDSADLGAQVGIPVQHGGLELR